MVNKSVREYYYNLKNNDLLKKSLNYLSLVIILYYAVVIIFSIFSSVHFSITNINYDYNLLLESLSRVFYTHSGLIMVPLFLMVLNLFKKNIDIKSFAVAILLSLGIESYHYLDTVVHPFLFSLCIYDFLLRENQLVLNPQYTKLFLYLILIFTFFILCILKRTRSIDRIFILLISSSVLITTIIFHFAIPMGMFKYAKFQEEVNLLNKSYILNNEELCKDKHCFILNSDVSVDRIFDNSDSHLLINYNYYMNGVINYDKSVENKITYHASLGDFRGLMFDYIITIVKPIKMTTNLHLEGYNGSNVEAINDFKYLIVMDDKVLKKYSRQSEIWFSFLSSVAHFIWIYGGMFLLLFHKRRFSKRSMKKN